MVGWYVQRQCIQRTGGGTPCLQFASARIPLSFQIFSYFFYKVIVYLMTPWFSPKPLLFAVNQMCEVLRKQLAIFNLQVIFVSCYSICWRPELWLNPCSKGICSGIRLPLFVSGRVITISIWNSGGHSALCQDIFRVKLNGSVLGGPYLCPFVCQLSCFLPVISTVQFARLELPQHSGEMQIEVNRSEQGGLCLSPLFRILCILLASSWVIPVLQFLV